MFHKGIKNTDLKLNIIQNMTKETFLCLLLKGCNVKAQYAFDNFRGVVQVIYLSKFLVMKAV